MRRELRVCATRLEATERRLALAHPGVRLTQQVQRLDDLAQRLGSAMRACIDRDRIHFSVARGRLERSSPRQLLGDSRARCDALQARLRTAVGQRLGAAAHRLALARRALGSVSPLATLQRGFAIVTTADGGLVTDAAAVAPGQTIHARLASGALEAQVTARKKDG
jgi:exodeoxyribonuclease VII large subunit